MRISELITNDNGRLSTTAFIQFFGALLMAFILGYCVYLDRSYTPELFMTFAIFCGGGVATKGFANAMRGNRYEYYTKRELNDDQ
ncbi:DUF2644 domain-containing protein [Actinobacillus seminis]|uniref:DUF2644 domain-containing protein n=1 Tax=Actinobacillus seminis TaxID=722 RepID=UPI003B95AF36